MCAHTEVAPHTLRHAYAPPLKAYTPLDDHANMCIYVYIHIYIYIYIYTNTLIYLYIIQMHIYIYIQLYTDNNKQPVN